MKRVLTLLCALVLLLSCFSGMAVSAATMEDAPAPETAVAEEIPEVPADQLNIQPVEETAEEEVAEEPAEIVEIDETVEMVEKPLFQSYDETTKAAFGATYEHELPAGLMDYLKEQFSKCNTSFSLSKFNIPVSRRDDLRSVIWYETPECFNAYSIGIGNDGKKLTTMTVTYVDYANTAAEYKACMDKFYAGAEYLLKGVKGNNALTNVEKALILHDRLAIWTEYDLENVVTHKNDSWHKIYNAYGILGEGLGVCQGYALAYMYLLEQVGIESDLCMSQDLWHSWNIVYLDGVPYYTDVTWDDYTNDWPNSSPYYDDWGRVRHVNFMRSYSGIWSTGHNKTDYPVVNAGTTYDSGWWWMNSNSSIELVGGIMYFVDNTNGKIYQQDDNGNIMIYAHSNASNGAFVRLTSAGTKLIIGDVWTIKTLDLFNGNVATLLDPSQTHSGCYVQGLKYELGKLWFQLRVSSSNSFYRYYTDTVKVTAWITKQPESVITGEGKTASVTVFAVGDGLTYAWYFKDPDKDVFSLSSNTTDTYTAVMNEWRNGRQVYCVVTDKYGNSKTSDTVTLTMYNSLKITKQPTTKSVADGKTISVPVTAKGDGLTYTWYFKDAGKSSFSKSSITTNTYSTAMTEAKHNRQIYCVVADQYGNTLKTNTVSLKVLKITSQPGNAVAANGKKLSTKVVAVGDGLTYTWYYAKKGSSTYTKASTTSATYSVTSSSSVNGRTVYCVVKDKYGTSIKTRVATLYKGTPAKITTQPKSVTVAIGKTIKITMKASGSGLKYAWYFKDVGKSEFSKSSVTSSTYTATMKANANGRQIYCVVTDKYGATVKTNVVTITKAVTAKFLSQPGSTMIVANGATAKITMKAEGDGLKYTWYYAKAGSTKYSKLSNTSNAYSVTVDSAKHGRKVYCVIKDKYGNSVKSNVVTLYNANNLVAGTWKESSREYASGWELYLEKMTLTISGTKVTLKAKDRRTGSTNTYTYTLKYSGVSGSDVNYKFSNSAETLYVTYNTSTKKMTVNVEDIAWIYFKK